MKDKLYVWVYMVGADWPSLCGEIDLIGGRVCRFAYSQDWLGSKNGFALSPDLPLKPGAFEPPSGLEIHPIFEDAAPDSWGRRVIEKLHNPRRRSHIDYLSLAGEDRIGALAFSWSGEEYGHPAGEAFNLANLAELVEAARAVEERRPIDDHLRRFLTPGSNAGGARPKALVKDGEQRWIAKFAADGDEVDVAAVEHASMKLAACCGIEVPDSKLIPVKKGNVLLVKRFDRNSSGRRIHFASARTMLLAQGMRTEDMSYWAIAEVARKLSTKPKEDCLELFRRMIFNVLIENTDDHEKNHAFLFDGQNWRLAPVYDVLPQLQGVGYQQLRIGRNGHESSLTNAISESGRFMLRRSDATIETERLVEIVRGWKAVFEGCGVVEQDIAACERYILKAPGIDEKR